MDNENEFEVSTYKWKFVFLLVTASGAVKICHTKMQHVYAVASDNRHRKFTDAGCISSFTN